MPTPTYVPLATLTLASADNDITFSSIPATYRDLILVINGKTSSDAITGIYVNGDTGLNYGWVRMWGTGSGTNSDSTSSNGFIGYDAGLTTSESTWVLQFMDYSATDKFKNCLVRSNQSFVGAWCSNWRNTAAITSLNIFSNQNWVIGSTFSLYGVN